MKTLLMGAICALSLFTNPTFADQSSSGEEIPVNIDNFVRVATDFEFGKYESLAGGVNRFLHISEPTPVDQQTTIRMNRDTLYSTAVVDISKGATLTLPDSGDRYMTLMVVNQDHYINEVFSGGGTHKLDLETFETPFVSVWVRILVDAANPEDIKVVNALQEQVAVEANSSLPFNMPSYDEDGYRNLVATILTLGPYTPDASRMFGARKDVDAVRHFIGTAGGWGGLPEQEAFYVNIDPNLPVSEYVIEVPKDVPVEAFWSISLYNAQGFFEPNELDAYAVNSVTGARNEDGSMTVHLGGCKDGRINCLPIMEGWNYTVRMYRPGNEILDGSWSLPEAKPVQ